MRRAIYAITLVLLGALIVQSVWGAQSAPAQWKAHSGQSVTIRDGDILDTMR